MISLKSTIDNLKTEFDDSKWMTEVFKNDLIVMNYHSYNIMENKFIII